MKKNKMVVKLMSEARVTQAMLAESYGISPQAMNVKLHKEQPASVQDEWRKRVLEIARENLRRAEEMA